MKKNGFTLIEMAIALIIVAFIVMGAVAVGSAQINVQRQQSTIEKMKIIEDAMMAYMIKNQRLPCPAIVDLSITNANFGVDTRYNPGGFPHECNVTRYMAYWPYILYVGAVPVRTLGLPDEMMFDGWGNRIEYATTRSFVNDWTSNGWGCGNIINTGVTDPAGDDRHFCFSRHIEGGSRNFNIAVSSAGANITTNGAYVLISHGKNGFGAYPRLMGVSGVAKNTNPTDADELKNIDTNFNQIFVQKNQTSTFDDIVRFKARNNLVAECNKIGANACSAFAW